MYVLPDVWIRPPFGGRGRKMTGQLEAHANGFRYTSPKGETLDIMYRCGMRCILLLTNGGVVCVAAPPRVIHRPHYFAVRCVKHQCQGRY